MVWVLARKGSHQSSGIPFPFICSSCWKGVYVSGIGGASAGSLGIFAAGTFKSSSLLTWTIEASILVFW
ncbi:hypothetical protein L3X38_012513 [Prunus dulcis]|uniref:Uncharacterized protein n=1 Tax=Prunus dulcis TaxID=3755 RepID=A0AAD4WK68_PRUDU|nr:hypothetical protein L3X38_012513 [Prunus dulcis]